MRMNSIGALVITRMKSIHSIGDLVIHENELNRRWCCSVLRIGDYLIDRRLGVKHGILISKKSEEPNPENDDYRIHKAITIHTLTHG